MPFYVWRLGAKGGFEPQFGKLDRQISGQNRQVQNKWAQFIHKFEKPLTSKAKKE
jgi:hypothetical protein